jgi:Flp pilus assembly protein protease CpaA
MIQILQMVFLGLGTLVGGITDAKTGYIYDWVTHPLIIFGIISSLFWAIQGNYFNYLSGAVIFGILYLVYKTGKLGGGDVKLFTGIALLNPFSEINFLMTLVFFSAISAMLFYSFYYIIKSFRKGIDLKKEKDFLKSMFVAILTGLYFIVMYAYGFVSELFILLFGIPVFLGLIFMGLQTKIKKEFYETKISIKEIEEDEVLGNNSKKVRDLLKGKEVIGLKEKDFLKKKKIKQIVVLRNLPKFGPFIFVGTIIAIINPNLLILLF